LLYDNPRKAMPEQMPELTGKRILVVEDDAVSRIFLRELLSPTGVLIDFARSGGEALQYFRENNPPHLVLMDIKLPDTDGFLLSEQILAMHKDMLIIAQTAFASESFERRCKEVGMKAYITKPIRQADLMRVMTALV